MFIYRMVGRSEDFFAALDDIARRSRTRFLICIDAINEGQRKAGRMRWRSSPNYPIS